VLRAVDVRPLDGSLGRRAGVLLGQAGGADVVDAAVVLICDDGDEIFTSDPDDLKPLAALAGTLVDLIAI
jgi:hypothetical protein